MSYCRWSTDDFQCDLYCYENVSGAWTTHVAANRVVFREPLPPPVEWSRETAREWMDRHKTVMAMMEVVDRVPIGLPYDGETFDDPSLEEFEITLMMLRKHGYRFPDHVLDMVREEIAEGLLQNKKEGP